MSKFYLNILDFKISWNFNFFWNNKIILSVYNHKDCSWLAVLACAVQTVNKPGDEWKVIYRTQNFN
jgi:hypothetical protein